LVLLHELRRIILQLTVLAKRAFPKFKTRLAIRRVAFFPLDALDFLAGRRDPLIPPRGLWFVGGGGFRDNQFLNSFIKYCDLKPDHHILDVGCGIGKQAVPLTQVLGPAGSYEGFDIVEAGIEWCQGAITSRYPTFTFRHVNVFNKHYNPEGTVLPEQFKFPYSDASFDFVYLISVFTHMLPEAVRNYIGEIGRVLKPGAKSFISFFLLNDSSRRVVADGKSKIPLNHERGDYAVADPAFPETAIGLSEDMIRRYYDEAGLEIKDIHYGSWCRPEGPFFQDIVIAVRR
jgi:ubiquinone/menaquinone biosynthesis C-methylase UbiE